MRRVDLDCIEARSLRPFRGADKTLDDPGDVVLAGFLELRRRASDRLQQPTKLFAGKIVRHIHRARELGMRRHE